MNHNYIQLLFDIYTLWANKNYMPLRLFVHNFGKCEPIYSMFSLFDSEINGGQDVWFTIPLKRRRLTYSEN